MYTKQTAAFLVALLATVLLAGCSTLQVSNFLPDTLMNQMGFVSDAAEEQRQNGLLPDAIPSEVIMLTRSVDRYLGDYQKLYNVKSRVADTPKQIAEAYLREHQPGPLPRIFETTYIYDRHGELLAEVIDEGYRTWVPLDRISPHVINAVVATEDASFFQNPGFDPRRIVGAMMQNAEAGEVVSGASTITMQLARHLFFTPAERFDQNMERKAFEALLAQDLTRLYSKQELLEMYLNLVHFGQQVYGVEAAAQLYFGKHASELTIAEATLISGIPQLPADYDLYRNFELVRQRQRIVLDLMVRHGYMSYVESQFIFAQEVEIRPENRGPQIRHAPHFVQYILQNPGGQLGDFEVRRSGMRILTTLDLRMHQLAQQIVAEQVLQLQPRYDLSNAALVALKPGTAEILVMVGSADFDNAAISGQVNVTMRDRQPGSAIKPMLYALAMDDNMISPASVIWDLEAVYRLSRTDNYRPRNYDSEFHGPVTVRSALGNSYNIPAVKLLDATGMERMLDGSRQMGIHSLNRDLGWYGLSLTLGGGEVTLLDLTTAFHTLANNGAYVPPQAVIFTNGAPDSNDFRLEDAVRPVQVVSPEAAFLTTHIMADNEARTPAFGANSPLRLSRPAAAKTGTTSDWRDNWTEGYTRYLVAGVWAGNSDGRPMRNVSGITGAAPIWQAFMEAVIADPELRARLGAPDDPAAWEFVPPPGVVELPINCPARVSCPETEYFAESWLNLMGDLGPLGDSALGGPVRTVYINNRPIAACSDERQVGQGGATRMLHRAPMGIGGNLPGAAPFDALVALDSRQINLYELETREERIRQEQEVVLRWIQRTGNPLHLGPCDGVGLVARAVFGAGTVARISGYMDSVAVFEEDESESERVAEQSPPPLAPAAPAQGSPSAAGSSRYDLMGVAHDASCGGTYVLGLVGNTHGGLVPGVRVVYSDSLGNRVETVTSSDPASFGSFRFPVQQGGQAHDIYISLHNSSGAVVGGPAVVQHNQGGASDQPCHHVIWRGVD